MKPIASPAQLRASLLRWSLFLVPAVVLLGYLSGLLSGSSAENYWFQQLAKPDSYPQPIVFPIVWMTLYVMMGFAFAMVCSAWGSRFRLAAILAFVVQLALNLAWSPVFFRFHQIETALYVLAALDVAVLVTIALFWKVRRNAALLLVPYLAWICFATFLNWQFLQLNGAGGEPEAPAAVQRFEL